MASVCANLNSQKMVFSPTSSRSAAFPRHCWLCLRRILAAFLIYSFINIGWKFVGAQPGYIFTVAGKKNVVVDGVAATSAAIYNPSAIAMSSSGDLYIADMNNFAIRKVRSPLLFCAWLCNSES